MGISTQMKTLTTGATAWTNAVSEVGDVQKGDVAAVVAEINRTMEQAIQKLLRPVPGDMAALSRDSSKGKFDGLTSPANNPD